MYEPLIPAKPIVNEHGVAQHPEYGDVYHSLSGAFGQTDHVFLQGNELPDRWQGQAQFTICETGFGLGNNFLATWYRWRNDLRRSHRLHFVSFEAHPLTRDDLQQQLARSAQVLQPLAQELLDAWPALLPGLHRLNFDSGRVTLTLLFGRIEQTAPLVEVRADAFFLDGFSPRLNPAMWTPAVFRQLVRMAAPGAMLATWCTASAVRRGLQEAGFLLEKRPGFGYKREMLAGRLRAHLGRAPAYTQPPQQVAVIGAGITGAAISYALAQRGIRVRVFDPTMQRGLGAMHQGHHAVAMRPLLGVGDPPRARLSRLGLALAKQQWEGFLNNAWYLTPALQLAQDADQAQAWRQMIEQLSFDPKWVQWLAPKQAEQFLVASAPHGGIAFYDSYQARPQQLIERLLSHELISLHAETVTRIHAYSDLRWQVDSDAQSYELPAVILANAQGAYKLLSDLGLLSTSERLAQANIVYGQVGNYAAAPEDWPADKLLSGAGYALNDRQGHLILGSSYERGGVQPHWSASTQQAIEQKLKPFMPKQIPATSVQSGWVGQRLAMRDHRPVITELQPVEQGLWLATAMGSYGFSWASVAAEQIAAQMSQEPHILTLDLQRAVALR